MFKFDPSIAHINPHALDSEIERKTAIIGARVQKEIKEKIRGLCHSCSHIIIDLKDEDVYNGNMIVRRNIISGLESIFRGRISGLSKPDEVLNAVDIKEDTDHVFRFVKLEFKEQ